MQYFLLFIMPIYFWSALYLYDEYGPDMTIKMGEFKNNINYKTEFDYEDFNFTNNILKDNNFDNLKCYITNNTTITISKNAILNDGYYYFKLLHDTDVLVL